MICQACLGTGIDENEQPCPHGCKSDPIDAADHIQRAKITRYDHGGGRMWFEGKDGTRHLIADFYGSGEYREYILSMLGHTAKPGDDHG